MSKRAMIITGISLVVAAIAVAVPLAAHHAFGAEFDPNRPLLLKGPVIKVEWVNPHTWIHMEHTEEDGTKHVWMVEGGTPNTLLRRGLSRDDLQAGTVIIVVDGHTPGRSSEALWVAWLETSSAAVMAAPC